MKTVVFDFDGTLTVKSSDIWKSIFIELGYDVKDESGDYKMQMKDFFNNKITYQEWCDQTCKSYTDKKFSKQILYKLADKIKLLNGFDKTIKTLVDNNIELHIVSGNFVEVIKYVLGDKAKYFKTINASRMVFDDNDLLTKIVGTEYDFDGKAKFITEYCQKNKVNPSEVCFVGNGDNDEWAYKAGCKTICVNPENTDHTNLKVWNKTLHCLKNLEDILPEIL